MASQVQIPFEGVILQEHSAPISCPTPNFAKSSNSFTINPAPPRETRAGGGIIQEGSLPEMWNRRWKEYDGFADMKPEVRREVRRWKRARSLTRTTGGKPLNF